MSFSSLHITKKKEKHAFSSSYTKKKEEKKYPHFTLKAETTFFLGGLLHKKGRKENRIFPYFTLHKKEKRTICFFFLLTPKQRRKLSFSSYYAKKRKHVFHNFTPHKQEKRTNLVFVLTIQKRRKEKHVFFLFITRNGKNEKQSFSVARKKTCFSVCKRRKYFP